MGVVAPGENDVIGPALKSELTLVTSRTPGSSDRVAVTASLVGKPVGVPKRPQVAVSSDEQGTSGDPLGLLLAVLWAQVLLVLVLVAGRLYHRWPRLAAHLVTTPAILVAAMDGVPEPRPVPAGDDVRRFARADRRRLAGAGRGRLR